MSAIAAIRPLILLCISSFFLMISHGLSGLLLPVRLADESVDVQSIGVILSLYSVGFLFGAIWAKKILRRIGLVRTFAMCGSLAATAILIMGLDFNTYVWSIMRAVMGFCIACAMGTLDTWYNSVSTESNRGKVLAVNQVVILAAITLGQFGLVLAPPSQATLFIICGLLFSISISPVVFISHFEPKIETFTPISYRELFSLSPLGFVACFLCGVLYSIVMNILPLYANDVGMDKLQISMFMGAATAGGIILQLPIGYLSDRFERRKVILSVCCVLLLSTLFLAFSLSQSTFTLSLMLVAIMMGIIACLYPLSISETFDRALKTQLVPVLSGLLCVYAIGCIVGPYSGSMVIKTWGNDALFSLLSLLEFGLVIFILYRMSVRQARPVEDQEQFVMHTPSSISEELDPRTEYHEYSAPFERAFEQFQLHLTKGSGDAIRYLKTLSQVQPEWVIPLIRRVPDLSQLDLIALYRVLSLTASERLDEYVSVVSELDYQQAEKLAAWLFDKEPEGAYASLAAMTTANDNESIGMIETLVESHPEKLSEFTQQLVDNVVESTESMRAADREAADMNHAVADLLSTVEQSAPQHTQELVAIIEEAIAEHELDSSVFDLPNEEGENQADSDSSTKLG
ncbi:MFS transporter [Vibrio litoralis]|uniref:MFS transporter n=1 Tax=Vibrio litoralis TaxID=335972 RepID=UPI000411FD0B|nr:MFS transporter [Vibrio litoralis]